MRPDPEWTATIAVLGAIEDQVAPAVDACGAAEIAGLIDGLDGLAPHVTDRVNFAVFAKTPVADFRAWAQARGWRNVRLLSTNGTSYNTDYVTERDGSDQIPIINVFKRTPDGIFHSWGSELFYAPAADGQHPRHADMIWPVWNLLDMTPEGRDGWFPRNSYD